MHRFCTEGVKGICTQLIKLYKLYELKLSRLSRNRPPLPGRAYWSFVHSHLSLALYAARPQQKSRIPRRRLQISLEHLVAVY